MAKEKRKVKPKVLALSFNGDYAKLLESLVKEYPPGDSSVTDFRWRGNLYLSASPSERVIKHTLSREPNLDDIDLDIPSEDMESLRKREQVLKDLIQKILKHPGEKFLPEKIKNYCLFSNRFCKSDWFEKFSKLIRERSYTVQEIELKHQLSDYNSRGRDLFSLNGRRREGYLELTIHTRGSSIVLEHQYTQRVEKREIGSDKLTGIFKNCDFKVLDVGEVIRLLKNKDDTE